MAYFARKLRYAAGGGDAGMNYIALIELAKRKGGKPVGFVLYRRIIQYFFPNESKTEMVRLEAVSGEEAVMRFWFCEKDGGKEFLRHVSSRWERTTLWLDFVAAGGGYESFDYQYATDDRPARPGRWVKVGTPSPWSSRHKKRVPKFGDLGYVLRWHQTWLRELKEQQSMLECLLPYYTSDNDVAGEYPLEADRKHFNNTVEQIEQLDEEILAAQQAVDATEAEMKAKVRLLFPNPVGKTPRRELRRQIEMGRSNAFW